MAHLTLIRGLPGSGKSTIAKNYKALHLEADMYFIHNGEYSFDKNLLKNAHDWCQNNARHALENGLDVVVANTFVKVWELQKYAKIARNTGATFSITEATGRYSNIHGIPVETLRRMENQWEKVFVTAGMINKL